MKQLYSIDQIKQEINNITEEINTIIDFFDTKPIHYQDIKQKEKRLNFLIESRTNYRKILFNFR